jgi:hypothetical protein
MPSEAGTRIVQSFDVLQLSPIVAALYATVVPGHRDRTEALRADLARLATLAESI